MFTPSSINGTINWTVPFRLRRSFQPSNYFVKIILNSAFQLKEG